MRPDDLMPEEPKIFQIGMLTVRSDTLITEFWDGELFVTLVPTASMEKEPRVTHWIADAYEVGIREGHHRGQRQLRADFRALMGQD